MPGRKRHGPYDASKRDREAEQILAFIRARGGEARTEALVEEAEKSGISKIRVAHLIGYLKSAGKIVLLEDGRYRIVDPAAPSAT